MDGNRRPVAKEKRPQIVEPVAVVRMHVGVKHMLDVPSRVRRRCRPDSVRYR
jgi:hypothetical protein